MKTNIGKYRDAYWNLKTQGLDRKLAEILENIDIGTKKLRSKAT